MEEELLIGLISDTHLESNSSKILDTVLNEFQKKNIDYIFHLGDFTSFKVYNQLISIFGRKKVIAVLGNMDKWDKNLAQNLPITLEIEFFGKKIFMVHGSGAPLGIIQRLNQIYDLTKYDVVVFGHTHNSMNKMLKKDGILYFNPGACRKNGSFGFLRISKTKIDGQIINL